MDLIANFHPINKIETKNRHFMNQKNFYTYNRAPLFHEPLGRY
jgi:hypothetical protein